MTKPTPGQARASNDRRQQVVGLLKALETRDRTPLSIIDPENYKQHNLLAEDGLEGLKKLLQTLP